MKVFKPIHISVLYLFLLWIALTGINIKKAFHIDDTFHLEAAENIGKNLLKPMSGFINWEDSPTPMYEHNQPPLFFYIIYIQQLIFGTSELSMHLLLSVFTFVCLLFFLKLTKLLHVKSPLTILTLFAFCPAFVVNQNLMTDIPILAMALVSIYFLLKGQKTDDLRYYLFSVVFLSVGLLIKYTLLPLFFVVLIAIVTSKKPKKAIVLCIPLSILLLWSIWNYLEYGAIHIISRPRSKFNIYNVLAFFSTLGAISTFTAIYMYNVFPKRFTRFAIVLFCILLILCVPLVYLDFIEASKFNRLLNKFFLYNGILLLVLCLCGALKSFIEKKYDYLKTPKFIIITYILGFSAFIALFAPFNATRHVLLLIPFLLLIGHEQFEKTRGLINVLVLTISIIVGILLGVSDWIYADFYRKNVPAIKTSNSKVWSLGHWGWQWYSKNSGMSFYAKNNEFNVRKGDLIVIPKDISKQKLSIEIELDTLRFITEPQTFFTFFSGKKFASMYNSFVSKPAWSLSKDPIDTIFICQVKKEIGVKDVINRIKMDKNRMKIIRKKSLENNKYIDSILVLEAKSAIAQQRLKTND